MDRMMTFSDGVYGIAMTLIVLDISAKDRLEETRIHVLTNQTGDTVRRGMSVVEEPF